MNTDNNTKTVEINQKAKTAFFVGQDPINKSSIPNLARKLEKVIKAQIDKGIVYFGCGGASMFDQLGGLAVLNIRKDNPDVKLIMVLPCKVRESLYSGSSTQTYKQLKENADKVVYTSERQSHDNIKKRNLNFIKYSGLYLAYPIQLSASLVTCLPWLSDNSA
jgi:uncharacterized phage-like protein YoqJ